MTQFCKLSKRSIFFSICLLTTTLFGQSPAKLTLQPSTKMTIVGGQVWCSGFGMEVGSSILGNGGFVFPENASVTIKQNIIGTGLDSVSVTWHDASSPTSQGTAATFTGGLMNWYDEPSQFWMPVTSLTEQMVAGKGYSVAIPATSDVIFTGGIPNSGDFKMENLTSTQGMNNGYEGWNLIGNPFPSSLDWDIGSWNRNNVDAAVYIWKQEYGNYVCWPAQSGFGTMSSSIIPLGQGFMVHVTTSGLGSINIPEDARVHDNQSFYKSSVPDLLTLEVNGDKYKDRLCVHFDVNATESFDPEMDALKLDGLMEAPQLYSILGDKNLTINVVPNNNLPRTIPVGLNVGQSGNYTISSEGVNSFLPGTTIFLEDLQLKRMINLSNEPIYQFFASKEDKAHRFNLHFNPQIGSEAVAEMNAIQIYSSGKVICVYVPVDFTGNVQVFNLLGERITKFNALPYSLNKSEPIQTSGYYFVIVSNSKGNKSVKVIIR